MKAADRVMEQKRWTLLDREEIDCPYRSQQSERAFIAGNQHVLPIVYGITRGGINKGECTAAKGGLLLKDKRLDVAGR